MMKVKPQIQRKLSKSYYIVVHCQKKVSMTNGMKVMSSEYYFYNIHMYIFSQTLTGPQLYSAQAQKILNSHKGGYVAIPPP